MKTFAQYPSEETMTQPSGPCELYATAFSDELSRLFKKAGFSVRRSAARSSAPRYCETKLKASSPRL